MNEDIWYRCLERLGAQLPEAELSTWLRPLVPAINGATYAGQALNGNTVATGDAVESTM